MSDQAVFPAASSGQLSSLFKIHENKSIVAKFRQNIQRLFRNIHSVVKILYLGSKCSRNHYVVIIQEPRNGCDRKLFWSFEQYAEL